MVFTADNMGDAHVKIVSNYCEMEYGFVEAFGDNEILEVGGVEFDPSADHVLEYNFLVRILESDDRVTVALLLRFFFGNVRESVFNHLLEVCPMVRSTVALTVKFIVGNAKPLEAFKDVILVFFGASSLVGVLDTKGHFAAMVPSKKKSEYGCSVVAGMQKTGRAWGKSGYDGVVHTASVAWVSVGFRIDNLLHLSYYCREGGHRVASVRRNNSQSIK